MTARRWCLLLASLACVRCSTAVEPPPRADAAADVARDASTPADAPADADADADASSGDAGPSAGRCREFPATPVATAPDGPLHDVIAEAARACAVGGVCLGADARDCVQGYLEARAGSVSLASLALRGDLVGTLPGGRELAAVLLAGARECVLGARDCLAVARCLGAAGVPSAMTAEDESACQGAQMLVRARGGCGNDGVVAVDCAAYGLRCVRTDVGQVMCAAQECPSASTRPQCAMAPEFRQCTGGAQVEGSCAGRPWLVSPACWIDFDDNSVECASGQTCDHEYAVCTADDVDRCAFHGDAMPNFVREQIHCAAVAPGLHCGPLPGTPTQVACLAGSACVPGAVSCAGSVASACAFGAPATVDCAALGAMCAATGCVGAP